MTTLALSSLKIWTMNGGCEGEKGGGAGGRNEMDRNDKRPKALKYFTHT